METVTLNVYAVVLYMLAAIVIIIGMIHGIIIWKYLDKGIYKIINIIYIFLLLCAAGSLVYAYPLVFN